MKIIITETQAIETCNIRYGVDNPSQNEEIHNKKIQTSIKNHGVECSFQKEEIRKKGKNTCINKYGVENYNQRNYSIETQKLLNDKEWLIKQHHDDQKTIQYIAGILNINNTTLSRYLKKNGIELKQFQKSMTEDDICASLPCEVITNNRNIISPYEIDIYLPEYKLAIEYCGLYWHSELYKDKNYHLNKLQLCEEKGIRLITIFEDEWLENEELVKEKLLNIIGKSEKKRLYARKCEIVTVNKKDKKIFLNENHIQGDGKSSVNIGLKI